MHADPSRRRGMASHVATFSPETCLSVAESLVHISPQMNEEALRLFRRAARAGFAEAQYKTAVCYLYGIGTEQDTRTGMKWLAKAAIQKHGQACMHLSSVLTAVDHDNKVAYELELMVADSYDDAMISIADRYFLGRGVIESGKHALAWYQKAFDHGRHECALFIGHVLENGANDVKQDLAEARKWYILAAVKNELNAYVKLGDLEWKKNNNAEEALKWFRMGTRRGWHCCSYRGSLLYLSLNEKRHDEAAFELCIVGTSPLTCACVFVRPLACSCACACACACTYACTSACACASACACVCAYTYASACDMRVCARACVCLFVSLFVHMCFYVCTQESLTLWLPSIVPGAEKNHLQCQALLVYMYEYGVGVASNAIKALRWRAKFFKCKSSMSPEERRDVLVQQEKYVFTRFMHMHQQLVDLQID